MLVAPAVAQHRSGGKRARIARVRRAPAADSVLNPVRRVMSVPVPLPVPTFLGRSRVRRVRVGVGVAAPHPSGTVERHVCALRRGVRAGAGLGLSLGTVP